MASGCGWSRNKSRSGSRKHLTKINTLEWEEATLFKAISDE
jgi:hypothetical protein